MQGSFDEVFNFGRFKKYFVKCLSCVIVHRPCLSSLLHILVGYFTSRPALKGYCRKLNSLLQVCKQLEVLGEPLSKARTTTATSAKLRKEREREREGDKERGGGVQGTWKRSVR